MNHRTITMRTIFERATLLQLFDEPEFKNNISLRAVRGGNPLNEHYFAVFVYDVESQDDGTIRLCSISTTLVGIQRYTIRRLIYQGIYVARQLDKDQLLFATLRAHYRAEEQDFMETLSSVYGPKMRWTKNYPNGAGDLSTPFEFVIEDPDLADLNALFNLGTQEEDGEKGE